LASLSLVVVRLLRLWMHSTHPDPWFWCTYGTSSHVFSSACVFHYLSMGGDVSVVWKS